MTPTTPGARLHLRLHALAFGGDAVARSADGRVVFVAGGAPGDLVEVRVDEVKANFARASLLTVLEPGAEHVAPPCPLASRCGGCQWQEVSRSAQHAAKHAVVSRALGRLGAHISPLVPASSPFGWRTRARFHVAGPAELGPSVRRLGISARRSHHIVDVPACLQLHPDLERAFAFVRQHLLHLLPEGAAVSGLVGRQGVHLALSELGAAHAAVRAAAPDLVGTHRILGVLVEGQAVGAAVIDTAQGDEPPFLSSAAGFAQASARGNQILRHIVQGALGYVAPPDARLLELYAGDGNFTRDLAYHGPSEVLAVEGDAAAVERLGRNVPHVHVRARCAPAPEEVARLAARAERFDAVLLDPPRGGARELLQDLARLTDHVVYVSCDPMTLGRDAAELAAFGLAPRQAIPIDLMPQTYHVETVCLLTRPQVSPFSLPPLIE